MMNEQVMIYEVKSAAAANAVELFSQISFIGMKLNSKI